MSTVAIDPTTFRQVLGQFPTGVVVVSAMAGDEPIGMTVGSFTSVSLDPPLVAFLPAKSSSSWAALRAAGDTFCINILAADQEGVCRAISTRKTNKFDGIPWHMSSLGHPIIDDAVATIECSHEVSYEGGDHDIVVGRVKTLEVRNPHYPLLFFRGGYGSFHPASIAAAESDLVTHLSLVDVIRPSMERLASRFGTEVTTATLVNGELVQTATAGFTSARRVPTRVGARIPFAPPVGSVFAAWGSEALRKHWLSSVSSEAPAELADEFTRVLDRVKARGYAVTFDQQYLDVEPLVSRLALGDPNVSVDDLRAEILRLATEYNPDVVEFPGTRFVQFVSVPVFANDQVAFHLTLWGTGAKIAYDELLEYVAALNEEAELATETIAEARRVGVRQPQHLNS